MKLKMKIEGFCMLLFVALAFASGCKKTIDYKAQAKNQISSFKVINLPDTVILASVDHIDNTITVYLPYYYGLSVIQPKITIDEGATLSPSPSAIPVESTNQTFEVKGADGTVRIYKLIIIQQNPPFLSLKWAYNVEEPNAVPGGSISVITGNFQSTSTATLKISLENTKTNKVITTDISGAFINANPSTGKYIMSVKTSTDIDSGYYKVKVSFLGNNVTMDKPVHVYYPLPSISPTWNTQNLAVGDTLVFVPDGTNLFNDLKTVTATIDGKSYQIPIKSASRLKATIIMPTGLPVGNWGAVPFIFQFGNFKPVTTNVPLIIKAKTN